MENKKYNLPEIKSKLPAPKMKTPKRKTDFERICTQISKRYPKMDKEKIEEMVGQATKEIRAICCGSHGCTKIRGKGQWYTKT